MHVLILGGTGASGRALIDHLASQRPALEVSVVSRTATYLRGAHRVLTLDFADAACSEGFRSQLATVDAIVHLADGLSILQQRRHAGDVGEAQRLVENSARLAQAASDARVPLFIYVSSLKAIGDEEDSRVLVEASEPRSTTLYGVSKLRLEGRIASALRDTRTNHVVLRIPAVYGRSEGGSLARLLGWADTPLPLPLAGLTNRRSLLCHRNLASALSAIVRSGRYGPGGTFHVHDGPPLSTTDIVTTLRTAMGRPARLFQPPAMAARSARRAPVLGPIARRLMGSLELSDAHFRRRFPWWPVIDTRAALAEMAAHLAAWNGRGRPAQREMDRAA